MPNPKKIETVAEIRERFESCTVAVATQYIGINVEQVTALRCKLRAEGITFKVYKNKLVKRALDELGLSDAAEFTDGPTAWAFSEDPTAPARLLKEFGKEVQFVVMNGGVLEGKVASKEQMVALADLPSREVLLAQAIGTMAAPLRNFVGVLNALPRNLVNVLDQIKKQKEEAEAA